MIFLIFINSLNISFMALSNTSTIFTIPEKYGVTTHYVGEDPGWRSIARTSIQLSLMNGYDHPIMDYIKPEYIDHRLEHVLRRIAAEDGEIYTSRYYFKAVRPTCEDISVLNRPFKPIMLAWFIYGDDAEEISASIRHTIEWLESGVFISETKKHKKLNKLLRQIYKLQKKSEYEKLNAEEIAKLGREDAILEELEKDNLDRRGPCY